LGIHNGLILQKLLFPNFSVIFQLFYFFFILFGFFYIYTYIYNRLLLLKVHHNTEYYDIFYKISTTST